MICGEVFAHVNHMEAEVPDRGLGFGWAAESTLVKSTKTLPVFSAGKPPQVDLDVLGNCLV